MGYAAEKKIAEKKWGKVKLVTLLIVVAMVLILSVLSIVIPCRTWKYRVSLPKIEKRADGEMRIHFLDVGQSDATIIELPDGKIALIDGADSSKENEYALMRYLYALGVKNIDYLILTHSDEDHCGSMDVVVNCFDVKNVYLPLASETVNTQYAQLYQALSKEKDCTKNYVQSGTKLGGDNYTFTFLYPFASEMESMIERGETFDENANAYSAVVYLEYGGVGTLLTGDLTSDKEKVLASSQQIGILDVDLSKTKILKVGHHGSGGATTKELLDVLNLQTAVISCGQNDYGHPHAETLARLNDAGARVYRTDYDGAVIVSIEKNASTHKIRLLREE